MSNTIKIGYSCYLKNPKRPSAHYYARVRESGHVRDIDLHTKEKSVAEAWCALRKSEVERYNQYVICGEPVPDDLARKIVHADTLSFAQKGPSKASVSLRVCLDQHEADMRRRGLREQSISAYMRALEVTVPKDATLADVNTKSITDWLRKHDKLKSATRKLYSIALREFYKFLSREYGLSKDLILDWPIMVRAESPTKGHWTMQQMASIINHVQCVDKERERQFRTYLWVLATVGSRQGETGLLEWRDFRDGCLVFRAENTKGKRTRVCPLDMRIIAMINKLPRGSDTDKIFSAIPATQPARYQMLKYAIRRAGAPAGGLHQFRHSVCMLMYSISSDIKATAQYLGDGEATALKWYTATRESEDLRELVNKTYEHQTLIPGLMDDMIEAGLV